MRRVRLGGAHGCGGTLGCSVLAWVQVIGAPTAYRDKEKHGGAECRVKGCGGHGLVGCEGQKGSWQLRLLRWHCWDEPGRAHFCRSEMMLWFVMCLAPWLICRSQKQPRK